jgi:hypothetical protein
MPADRVVNSEAATLQKPFEWGSVALFHRSLKVRVLLHHYSLTSAVI